MSWLATKYLCAQALFESPQMARAGRGGPQKSGSINRSPTYCNQLSQLA